MEELEFLRRSRCGGCVDDIAAVRAESSFPGVFITFKLSAAVMSVTIYHFKTIVDKACMM